MELSQGSSACRIWAILLWFLGCSDQAREYSEQALSNAERLRHPFTLAFALALGAYLCQHLRDVEGTRYNAIGRWPFHPNMKFLHWKHQATMLRGWALAELGQIDDGLNQIRAGLDAYEAMESGLACSWFRSLLANAYLKAAAPTRHCGRWMMRLLSRKEPESGPSWRK